MPCRLVKLAESLLDTYTRTLAPAHKENKMLLEGACKGLCQIEHICLMGL
jgi:hypothetical protein